MKNVQISAKGKLTKENWKLDGTMVQMRKVTWETGRRFSCKMSERSYVTQVVKASHCKVIRP